MKVKIIERESACYPERLRLIKEPPEKLYCVGDTELLGTVCVSVVGSRKCSGYGLRVSERLGALLARGGVTVVSGLAAGIDAAAHRGAMDAGGAAIAVLGNGPDIFYPSVNRELQKRISEGGLVISEYPPGTKPAKYTFPRRNRIIAGLSEATVVAEAGLESGSLITAGFAEDQGRCVFAVPSNIDSVTGAGSNRLIRDGAVPLTVLGDIFPMLGIDEKDQPDVQRLGGDELLVMEAVKGGGEVTFDEVSAGTGLPPAAVRSIVTVLEIKGLLATDYGKIFVAK
ncbi:MAG: DNA-processing protein DprA [Anaerovoracaceae bacterium]|jgi:DNA processing protein